MITMELEFGVLANAESLMDRFAARYCLTWTHSGIAHI